MTDLWTNGSDAKHIAYSGLGQNGTQIMDDL